MERKRNYELTDPVPEDLEELRRQTSYWMSRQNEGAAGSNWEHSVRNKIDQLRWKVQQLAGSSGTLVPQISSSETPVIFLSCGQHMKEEKDLGAQVKVLLESRETPEVYFAEDQSSFDAFTRNILGALNRCVGFIGIMHKRGEVATVRGSITRASVWIEQEIAVAAFIEQILNRKIEVQLYIQEGIPREGMRDKLLLNSQTFRENAEVLDHLEKNIGRWRISVGRKATHDPTVLERYAADFAQTKSDFYVRRKREGDGQEIRSATYFLLSLVPSSFSPFDADVNERNAFIEDIYQTFQGHRVLVRTQGSDIVTEVTSVGAREFSLPLTDHGHSRRWGFTQQGTVRFVSQPVWAVSGTPKQLWSAPDTVMDLLSFLRLAASFWRRSGYKGTARLYAELNVDGAELSADRVGYTSLLGQLITAVPEVFVLNQGAILKTDSPRGLSRVFEDITSEELNASIVEFTARVAGQILGGFGYEVDLQKLREFTERIATTGPLFVSRD